MSIITNYLRIIHICIFCESENVEEEIEHELIEKGDKLICLMKYKYHCLDCNSKWELP